MSKIIGIGGILLIVAIFAFAIFMNKQIASQFLKEGVETSAKVRGKTSYDRSKKVKSKSNRGVTDTAYILMIEFEDVDGNKISTGFSEWVTKNEYEKINKGDTIQIVYLPSNPENKLVLKSSLERISDKKLNSK